MSKVFGFLIVALSMTTSMANAALLATWNFNSGAGGTVASGVDASATAFSNYGTPDPSYGINGSISGGAWNTAGILRTNTNFDVTKGNEFSLTNTSTVPPKLMLVQNVSFNAEMLSADPDNEASTIRIRVYTSLNNGPDVFLGFSPIAIGSFGTLQTITINQSLAASDTLKIKFVYSGRRLDANSDPALGIVKIDNITLNGTDNVVPEPASMACFAGLFAVGAMRRLRKRS